MKVVLRLLVLAVVGCLLLGGLAFWILTREGIQLRIARSLLPEGAQVERVKVGLGGARIGGFEMDTMTGQRLQLDEASVRVGLLPVLLSKRIEISDLTVSGLHLEVDDLSAGTGRELPADPTEAKPERTPAEVGDVFDMTRLFADSGYTVVVDKVSIKGRVTDQQGRVFTLDVSGGGMRPDSTARFDKRVSLSGANFETGLGGLSVVSSLEFSQDGEGVITSITLNSEISAEDTHGLRIVEMLTRFDARFDDAGQAGELALDMKADLTRPSTVDPRLGSLAGLLLELNAAGSVEGNVARLDTARLIALDEGRNVVSVDLIQPIQMDGAWQVEGDILSARIDALPLKWVEPFLPAGFSISGQSLSLSTRLAAPDGDHIVLSGEGLEVGPLVVRRDDVVVVDGFSLSLRPGLTLASDASAVFSLEDLAVTTGTGIGLSGSVSGSAGEGEWIVDRLDLSASDPSGQLFANLELLQPVRMGGVDVNGRPQLRTAGGEWMRLRLQNARTAPFAAFFPEGVRIEEQGISADWRIAEVDGAFQVSSAAPLTVNALSLWVDGEAVLSELDCLLPLEGRYGDDRVSLVVEEAVLSSGVRRIATLSASGNAPPTGDWLQGAEGVLEVDLTLPNLLRQPALAELAGLLDGKVLVNASFDGATAAVQMDAAVTDFITRKTPNRPRRYALELTATVPAKDADSLSWSGLFTSGYARSPNSELGFEGSLDLTGEPLRLRATVNGEQLFVPDMQALAEGFSGTERSDAVDVRDEPSAPESTETGPPWAGLDLVVDGRLQRVVFENGATLSGLNARAVVNESMVSLEGMDFGLGQGRVKGASAVRYDPATTAYSVDADVEVVQLPLEQLGGREASEFPVTGRLDGALQLRGAGADLEAAMNDLHGPIRFEGADGTIAGFDLQALIDKKMSSLGLGQFSGLAQIGLGILGSQKEYPGVATLIQMTPYFKDIPYDSIVLDLNRSDDRRVRVEQLLMRGDAIWLEGSGTIAPADLADILDVPLDLQLQLASRGPLAGHLSRLKPDLLAPVPDENGYFAWNDRFRIAGTLGEPDASSITDLLINTALGALGAQPGGSRETPKAQSGEPAVDLLRELLGR